MHVLYVTKKMPYGPEEAFIFPEVADHLANGWEVTIVPTQHGAVVHRQALGLRDRTLGVGLLAPAVIRAAFRLLIRRPRAVLSTFFLILSRTRSPKLLLRNLAVFAKGLWLAEEAARRDVEHIHVHWIAVPATMALVAARLSGLPMSITAHRYDIAQRNLIAEKAAAARFVRAIDGPGAAEIAAELPPGTPRPLLIHMGVRIAGPAVAVRPGELRRLCAVIGARFVEKKGHATLLEAIALARQEGIEVALDAFGDGPLQPRLEEQAARLGIADLVRFHGVMSHDGLLERLRSGDYDVAVLPSVVAADGDKEGIPVFLMESMAAGLPVIATPNGGIAELITPDSGILVPERDAGVTARALVRLAREPGLRERLSANGRRRVEAEFSVEACSRALRERIEGGPP